MERLLVPQADTAAFLFFFLYLFSVFFLCIFSFFSLYLSSFSFYIYSLFLLYQADTAAGSLLGAHGGSGLHDRF